MLSSHTLTQSGVGVNSSCRGTSVGDTCTVFCAEGYQAVSNETSALTCVCDRCANPPCLSFGIDCSECFRLTYNETCIVHCLVGDTGVDDKNTTELKGDSDGHLQDSLGCAEESRALAGRVLLRDDHFTRTDSNVSGTQVQTTAACSLWHKGRVEPPSRKWRTKRLFNTRWRVSGVSYEVAKDGRQRTDRTRGGCAPSERGGRKRRAGKTFDHSGISARGLGKTCRLGKDLKNHCLGSRL